MIQIEQDCNIVKTLYVSACKERNLPMQNKAVLLYEMLEQLQENPEDEDLRQLLFLALCDEEFLTAHFADYPYEQAQEIYQDILEEYLALDRKYQEQLNLEDTFSDYITDERYLSVKSGVWNKQWDVCLEEAGKVADLARVCLELGDEIEQTLLRNICGLISKIDEDDFLKRSKPYLLFAVLTRYTAILEKEEKIDIQIKSLFTHMTYVDEKLKKKDKKWCKACTKLYRKLYKLYKKDKSFDKKQCRYNFMMTSDLYAFAIEYQIDKCEKLCSPFMAELLFKDVSCQESEPNTKWEGDTLLQVTEEEIDAYDESDDTLKENYYDFLENHLQNEKDILIKLLYAQYDNENTVKELIDQVYQACKKTIDEKLLCHENAIKEEIYYIMMQSVDDMIEKKVYEIGME